MTTGRLRRQGSVVDCVTTRQQMVREVKAEKDARKQALQQYRDDERQLLADRRNEIRMQEQSALKRREQVQKQQQRELLRKAREKLAHEHEKKVRWGSKALFCRAINRIEKEGVLMMMIVV